MAKKVKVKIKLQIPGGEATPAPPVGTALGPHGINMMEFINAFNSQTADRKGDVLPVEMTVYEDRSFDFIVKTPPVAFLIKKELGLEKGSGVPNKNKVGKLTKEQIKKIAEMKMVDLNANDMKAAETIVAGTARSMGVDTDK